MEEEWASRVRLFYTIFRFIFNQTILFRCDSTSQYMDDAKFIEKLCKGSKLKSSVTTSISWSVSDVYYAGIRGLTKKGEACVTWLQLQPPESALNLCHGSWSEYLVKRECDLTLLIEWRENVMREMEVLYVSVMRVDITDSYILGVCSVPSIGVDLEET